MGLYKTNKENTMSSVYEAKEEMHRIGDATVSVTQIMIGTIQTKMRKI
jgi:hypothetical protein